MLKQACPICKVVGIFAILGTLNSGIFGLTGVNHVDKLFSHMHLARVVDALTCLAGVALLASYFMVCPACKK